MDDLPLTVAEIEPGQARMVPAALAGIPRDDCDGTVCAEEVEPRDGIAGRADLDCCTIPCLDLEEPPTWRLVGDLRVFGLAPPEPNRAIGCSAVEATIGGECNQRRAVCRPVEVLDRSRNIAESTQLLPIEHEQH